MDFDQWNEALSKGAFDQTEKNEKNPNRFFDFSDDDFEEEEDSDKHSMKN